MCKYSYEKLSGPPIMFCLMGHKIEHPSQSIGSVSVNKTIFSSFSSHAYYTCFLDQFWPCHVHNLPITHCRVFIFRCFSPPSNNSRVTYGYVNRTLCDFNVANRANLKRSKQVHVPTNYSRSRSRSHALVTLILF